MSVSLVASALAPRSGGPGQRTLGERRRAAALAALRVEQSRARKPLCSSAPDTSDLNSCLSDEFSTTDRNKRLFVKALGDYLATPDPDEPVHGFPTGKQAFDEGERAWTSYRDKVCEARGDMDEGGSGSVADELTCQITVTRRHMNELGSIYELSGN